MSIHCSSFCVNCGFHSSSMKNPVYLEPTTYLHINSSPGLLMYQVTPNVIISAGVYISAKNISKGIKATWDHHTEQAGHIQTGFTTACLSPPSIAQVWPL